jgi:hypothetical protein
MSRWRVFAFAFPLCRIYTRCRHSDGKDERERKGVSRVVITFRVSFPKRTKKRKRQRNKEKATEKQSGSGARGKSREEKEKEEGRRVD